MKFSVVLAVACVICLSPEFSRAQTLNQKPSAYVTAVNTAVATAPSAASATPVKDSDLGKTPTVESLSPNPSSTLSPFINLQAIKTALNFTPYYNLVPTHRVKIALFDRGFADFKSALGKSLPQETYLQPLTVPSQGGTDHGEYLAELIYGLMTDEGRAPEYAPIFYFYRTYGFTNFEHAIEGAIKNHVDVIVNSEVSDYGDNFDGQGLFNTQVNRATAAGITWFNAAGNYAQTTFNGPVVGMPDGFMQLPEEQTKLGLRCQPVNTSGSCSVRIVLSWNDFKNDVSQGTSKDLDLFLIDDVNNPVESSQLRQQLQAPATDTPGVTLYPREIITATLAPGHYFIKIKIHAGNFDNNDRFRVTGIGEGLSFDYTDVGESLLNPADNPNVITVGANDTNRSSVSVSMAKPELLINSSTKLDVDEEYRGSSQTAAIAAAGFAMMKSLIPEMDRNSFLALVSQPSAAVHMVPLLTTQQLGFKGTGLGGCFVRTQNPAYYAHVAPIVQSGGVIVDTTAGMKVMVPFNPLAFTPNQRVKNANDILAVSESGFEIAPRSSLAKLDAADVEIFQTPRDQYLCDEARPGWVTAQPHMNSLFAMPNLF